MRNSFFLKILALCLAVSLGAVFLTNLTFNLTAGYVVTAGIGEEAVKLAEEAASRVDASLYDRLIAGSMDPQEAQVPLVEELRLLQADLAPRGVENVYTLAPRAGAVYVIADPSGDHLPFRVADETNVGLKTSVYKSGNSDFTTKPYQDEWGTWISGYAPLRNSRGHVIAVLGVDLPLGAFPLMNEIVRRNLLVSLTPSVLLALLASIYFARKLTLPVRQLTKGLRRVELGDFSTQIIVRTRDELARMADAFNAMTRELSEKERIRSVFQQAVSKEIAEEMLRGGVDLDGEIREVTVLFSDLRGFTAMSEGMAARDVLKRMNEYFSIMAPIVSAHGGVIDKFVGDEIFAIFGAPVAIEDDAMAAIGAALEMKEALTDLNARMDAPATSRLAMGIGINTGAVVAGNVGSRDRLNYTVLGQTVNVGARLCSQAGPQEIVISQDTYLRVKGRVEVQPLPPLSVKGVTFALHAFKVLGRKDSTNA